MVWKEKKSKEIIRSIVIRLDKMQRSPDIEDEDIKDVMSAENTLSAGVTVNAHLNHLGGSIEGKGTTKSRNDIERSFKTHKDKLQDLDHWLPELKESVREFFRLSTNTTALLIQIDDLYHLKRTDQAFVVDYIHRLCKDLPLYFKIATLRHASTLYVDQRGQFIGAQERHDYEPINIDYTFSDFPKTLKQNLQILTNYGSRAGFNEDEVKSLFKGEGFERIVMAGGGVPRDVLSLILEALSSMPSPDSRIGKDDVRSLARTNFEQKISELKQDSRDDEQDDLLKGIYILREFCLEKQSNVFLVQERMLQENDGWRALFYRLLDYRIIHNCATALSHRSQEGTFQAFAIDIGCYAHLRVLSRKFNEIDITAKEAREKMRSAPILDKTKLSTLFETVPNNIEIKLLELEEE